MEAEDESAQPFPERKVGVCPQMLAGGARFSNSISTCSGHPLRLVPFAVPGRKSHRANPCLRGGLVIRNVEKVNRPYFGLPFAANG
jgi:hypothetical protein